MKFSFSRIIFEWHYIRAPIAAVSIPLLYISHSKHSAPHTTLFNAHDLGQQHYGCRFKSIHEQPALLLFIADGGLEWNGCVLFVYTQQLSSLGLKAFLYFLIST